MHSSFSHSCYMSFPSQPPWFHHSNYTWRRVQVMKLLIMQLLHPPVTSSPIGPNILLSTQFIYWRRISSIDWVELMLWVTVSRPVCLGVGHPFGAHDQIVLFPFFCRKIALLFALRRPLWRQDGSVICSPICQWSESRRTHNHTLLFNGFCRLCCRLRAAVQQDAKI
jgi:hypothetical protein